MIDSEEDSIVQTACADEPTSRGGFRSATSTPTTPSPSPQRTDIDEIGDRSTCEAAGSREGSSYSQAVPRGDKGLGSAEVSA